MQTHLVAVTRRSGKLVQHDFLDDVGQLLDLLGRADTLNQVDLDERHVAVFVVCW